MNICQRRVIMFKNVVGLNKQAKFKYFNNLDCKKILNLTGKSVKPTSLINIAEETLT